MMVKIETFVFLDMETTGLPWREGNKTKTTELSLVSLKRDHILDTTTGEKPRVLQKLVLCFNPKRMIHPESTEVTGLSNELLEYESDFNPNVMTIMKEFLNLAKKPVCFVAHNGNRFDYPILRAQIEKVKDSLHDDIMCVDTLPMFRSILRENNSQPEPSFVLLENNNENNKGDSQFSEMDEIDFQALDKLTETYLTEQRIKIESIERTPPRLKKQLTPKTPVKCQKVNDHVTPKSNVDKSYIPDNDPGHAKARRSLPFSENKKKESYKLKDVYERVLGRPAKNCHRAESDCEILLEIAVCIAKDFVEWSDNNSIRFLDIKPMEIGKKIS